MKRATSKNRPCGSRRKISNESGTCLRPGSRLSMSITEHVKICALAGVPLEVFLEIPAYIRHGIRLS